LLQVTSTRYFFYLIFVIPLFFQFCNLKPLENQISLVLADSVEFDVNSSFSKSTKSIFYFEEGNEEYFIYDDEKNNYLRIFNINKLKICTNIPLPVSLNKKPIQRIGFFIKNFDSIYIPYDGYGLLLIDTTGTIIKNIDFRELKLLYPTLNSLQSISRFSKPAIAINNNIYFIQSDTRLNYSPGLLPSDFHFCFKYNCISDSASVLQITLPNNFWETQKKQLSLSMAYDGKRFVYAPQYSHEIFTSIRNERINQSFFVKSKYVHDINSYFPTAEVPGFEDYVRIYTESQFYIGFLWDKYRKVYYRMFWPGMLQVQQAESLSSIDVFNFNPTFGIMVIDTNFQLVDELILPVNTYSWDKYFVGPKGLYLSADNHYNARSDETKWLFHIYSLVEKQ